MTMSHLKEAAAYETYAEYCAPRREIGLGVIPKRLFDALKEQEKNSKKMKKSDLGGFTKHL